MDITFTDVQTWMKNLCTENQNLKIQVNYLKAENESLRQENRSLKKSENNSNSSVTQSTTTSTPQLNAGTESESEPELARKLINKYRSLDLMTQITNSNESRIQENEEEHGSRIPIPESDIEKLAIKQELIDAGREFEESDEFSSFEVEENLNIENVNMVTKDRVEDEDGVADSDPISKSTLKTRESGQGHKSSAKRNNKDQGVPVNHKKRKTTNSDRGQDTPPACSDEDEAFETKEIGSVRGNIVGRRKILIRRKKKGYANVGTEFRWESEEKLVDCEDLINEFLEKEKERRNLTRQSDIDKRTKLICICRQPHNNRVIISCDRCEKRFHEKCIGVTKAQMKVNETTKKITWHCPPCRGTICSGEGAASTSDDKQDK